MNLTDGTILVTGAEGFIGSHLVEALVRRGSNVRAMVLYNSFNSWGWLDSIDPAVRDRVEIVMSDVRDPGAVEEAVTGCRVIFHLAALIAIPYSYRAPDSYVDTNVRGTLNIVQAARKLGVEKVVHTSTSEVYGSAKYVPIDEAHPLQPQSPYSASKIAADQMALSFFHAFKTPVAVCRPFNTFGPRQSNRAVIPTVITQIASGARTIRLGSTEPRRDFTYAEDTAEGMIAVAESDATVGRTVNLGTGFDASIGETVGMISEIMGAEVEIETDPQRVRPEGSEVDRLCADNRLARELTGWEPELAGPEGLREGLSRTIDWFTDPANLALYKADQYVV
ncbi:MAG: GDP-mannose 4,6-dehydratase [Phycisphaeraceae bacterium]|nr:MAG: GDP-mannose 4,6-dehydratase [Phycisphaeraceae bacterium]